MPSSVAVSCSAHRAVAARRTLPLRLPSSSSIISRRAFVTTSSTSSTATTTAALSASRLLLPYRQPATTPLSPSSRPCVRVLSSRCRRAYHSYDHPKSAGPFNAAEEAILAAAYRQVPEHGFTDAALAIGAREAGYLDISTNLLSDGAFSLIQWHLVQQREALAARKAALFADDSSDPSAVAARVEALTWERLLGNTDVMGRWQEALAVMAQPSYIPESVKELAMLADEILFLAGDVAVDPTWYTKRASLSTIYAAAELYMTTDHSPGYFDTRNFLRRRLGEANEFGSAAHAIRQWVGFTASAGLNMLRSKGMRI